MTTPQLRDDPAFCHVGDWFVDTERTGLFGALFYTLERFSYDLPIADRGERHRHFRRFDSPDGPAWRRVE